MSESKGEPSTADALARWREAERAVAVARRGKQAAEAAAMAAQEAATAAVATAEAAKAALEAAGLAESSAYKTAAAARVAAMHAAGEAGDASSDLALAEADELEAHAGYQAASDRAAASKRTGRA